MQEFMHVMFLPLVACIILAGIHAYLGFHIIERQVIFVDLALAQMAVLGAGVASVIGYSSDGAAAYWMSLVFTIAGAALFSLTRFKKQRIPHEAIIGIVYAVSAALLVMVLSRAGDGDEHIKQALVGNVLLVNVRDIIHIGVVYAVIGVFHFMFRRKFFLISRYPDRAFEDGINVRLWDFLFYVSLGIVVTSSARIAGVLLVFSFLVVPSVCAMMCSDDPKRRLVIGWAVGLLASILGMAVSYYLDFPTGASVVCAFGVILIGVALIRQFCRGGY